MKKLYLWLLLSLFTAAFTLTACGGDDDETNEPPKKEQPDNQGNGDDNNTPTVTVSAETLKGTWDGAVEHDFAQGYYQRWRFHFDGKNYTSWHTHQTVGSVKDDVQGLKTVGNKEQGTWEYKDGMLVLTPEKMWASYYFAMTSIQTGDGKYVYYNYNTETMEADQWYETSEAVIKSGIERDLQDNTDWYIKKWPVLSLTKTELSVKINMDTFKLTKQ